MQLINGGTLNTLEQYNPVNGGLHITGDWTFSGANDFLQILTRSDGTPTALTGQTQNGVQFQAENNNVTIVGNGNAVVSSATSASLTITAGATYSFNIVDNGTNLSFTLTQLGGSGASVTITAQSTSTLPVNLVSFHNRVGGHTSLLSNVTLKDDATGEVLLADNFANNSVLATDQRGVSREPLGDAMDIGAASAITSTGTDPYLPGWTANGGATLASGLATLVDGTNQASSLWNDQQFGVGTFSASFTYTDTAIASGDNANGIAFVLQNDNAGTSALGSGGASLGYAGLNHSLAVAFNVSSANTIGYEFLTDGVVDGSYQSTLDVNLNSGQPVTVNLTYENTTLEMVLMQGITEFGAHMIVNLPSILGSSSAYVGFTGGSGSQGSYQTVSNFTFNDANSMDATFSSTPLIPGLLSSADGSHYMSVAESFGLTTLTAASFHGLAPAPAQGLAAVLMTTGPGAYATAFPGYSYLFLINDTSTQSDPYTLNLPGLGIGTGTTTPLLNGGWLNDPVFGGPGPQPLAGLAPGQVYAVLVANGQTGYNVSVQSFQRSLNYGLSLVTGSYYYLNTLSPPTVVDDPAQAVSTADATLSATVDPHGSSASVLFQYSTDPTFAPTVQAEVGSGFASPEDVAVDDYGDVFVADTNHNLVKEVKPNGAIVTIGSGFSRPDGVAVDEDGDVFVADTDNDDVAEVKPNGSIVTIASADYTANSLNPGGVAVDAAGDVFIAYTFSEVVTEVKPDGSMVQIGPGFDSPRALAVDAAGDLFIADPPKNVVYEVTPGPDGTVTTIGSGFDSPSGVAVDAVGDVFVADSGNNAVKEVRPDGSVLTIASGFDNPSGVAVDAAGDVFVSDANNSQVVELSPTSVAAVPTSVSGTGPQAVTATLTALPWDTTYYFRAIATGPGMTGVATQAGSFTTLLPTVADGPATAVTTVGATVSASVDAQGLTASDVLFQYSTSPTFASTVKADFASGLSEPQGVAVDSAGDLFVADPVDNAVKEVKPDGSTVTIGSGFNHPQGVAVNSSGDVFVADSGNNDVKEVEPDGTIETIGSGFNNPTDLVLDSSGDLFVADIGSGTVKEITPGPGGSIVTIGAGFSDPAGVAVDAEGDVFVADSISNDVYEITPGPNSTTVTVGTGLSGPTGVAVDSFGDVFVANFGSSDVDELAPNGTITTVATGLSNPNGVVVDGSGDVFVADTDNSRVLELSPPQSVAASPSSVTGTEAQAVRATLAGLTAGTAYYFRAIATISGVKFTASPAGSFMTLVPPIVDGQAIALTGVSATVAATVDPRGSTDTVQFQYSTDPTFRSTSSSTVSATPSSVTGTGPVAVTAMLTGLKPGTTYYFRAIAAGPGGTLAGSPAGSFTTPLPPLVVDGPAQAVTAMGATIAATVDPRGSTKVFFQSSTDPTFTPTVQSGVDSGFNHPYGVAVDGYGDLFVADSGNNTVQEVTPDGTILTIGSGFSDPTGVAVDTAGDVFVADSGNNAVKEITSGGTILTIGAGFSDPTGVAVDSSGDVFVADSGNHAVKEVTPGGTIVTIGSGFNDPTGVAVDATGDVFVADFGTRTVSEVKANGTIVTNGSGFSDPTGVAVDAAGDVFVAGTGLTAVEEVKPNGTIVTIGSGFNNPSAVAVDALGDVFVADTGDNQIVELSPPAVAASPLTGSGTKSVTATLAGLQPGTTYYFRAIAAGPGGIVAGSPAGSFTTPLLPTVVDGSSSAVSFNAATLAATVNPEGLIASTMFQYSTAPTFTATLQTTVDPALNRPFGVAVDRYGDVFVADTGDNAVQEIKPDGTIVSIGAGFNGPSGVAVDAAGDVFVADTDDNAVEEVTPGGAIANIGSGFNDPYGVAVDADGDVFVADTGSNVVEEVKPNGTIVTIGSGFSGPEGVAVDAAGDVFVGDTGNDAVKEVKPDGTIVTIATGFTSSAYSGPRGLAVDAAGDVFVPNFNPVASYVYVEEITPGGSDISVGSEFYLASGVAVDGTGDVFVADWGNNQVVELSPPSVAASPSPVTGAGAQAVTATVTGLQPNTTYYFRAVASVDGATFAAGTAGSFTTLPAPTVVDGLANAVTTVSATVGATVNPEGEPASVLFQYSTDPTFAPTDQSILGSGSGYPDGVAVDSVGDVFLADDDDGDVREVKPDGSIVTIASGFSTPQGVAVDAAGDVFVADTGNNAVYEVTPGPDGTTTTFASGLAGPTGVAVDSAGDVFVAELGNNAVEEFEPNQTIETIGSGFNEPSGVAVDSSGDVFVADSGNNAVKEVTPDGSIETIGYGFSGPTGVAVDSSGDVFVADSGNNAVEEVKPNGSIDTIGSGFNVPNAVALAGNGAVFVADSGNGRIVALSTPHVGASSSSLSGDGAQAVTATLTGLTPDTTYYFRAIATSDGSNYAGSPAGSFTTLPPPLVVDGTPTAPTSAGATVSATVDPQGSTASLVFQYSTDRRFAPTVQAVVASGFDSPYGVAVDDGDVFVADPGSGTVEEIKPGGTIVTIGSGFNHPTGVAVDSSGDVFVVDTGSSAIEEITPDNSVISIGSGFNHPSGVAVDANGDVFVADSGSNAIEEVTPNGSIVTIGSGFSSPTGVALDAYGDVFVADSGNNSVKEVTPNGTITTIGSHFSDPTGVAVDPSGEVFVADSGNNSVEEFAQGGSIVTIGSGFTDPTGVAVDVNGDVFVADSGNGRALELSTPSVAASPAQVSGTGIQAVTATLTGLTSGATYYYRAIATVDGATFAAGSAGSFTPLLQPPVAIGQPSAVTSVGATVSATVNPQGSTASVLFQYSTDLTFTPTVATTLASGINSPYGVAVDDFGDVFFSECNNNAVEEVKPDGSIVSIGSGFDFPTGVAVDSHGDVFVADSGDGTIKEIKGGLTTTVASGFGGATGLAVDAAGDIFVSLADDNSVVEVKLDGSKVTIDSGLAFPQGVAVDSAGDVFVTAGLGGDVTEITPDGTIVTIGSGFGFPVGVAVDTAGDVFVADTDAAIKEIKPDGSTVTINSNNDPWGVAVSAAGDVFVTDEYDGNIAEVSPPSVAASPSPVTGTGAQAVSATLTGLVPATTYFFRAIDTLGGEPVAASSAGSFTTLLPTVVDGPASAVTAAAATVSATVNPQGGTASVLFQYSTDPTFSSALSTTPKSLSGMNAQTVTETLTGLTIGTTYYYRAIATIGGETFTASPSGSFTTLVPTLVDGSASAVTAVGATVSATVDPQGSSDAVYVQYSTSPTFTPAVQEILGSQFSAPNGAAVDAAGDVFVAEFGNNAVEEFKPNGTIMSIGSGFDRPMGVAVNAAGDVFVADFLNNAIKEIIPGPDGTTTTFVSGVFRPTGVAVDSAGDVFVTTTVSTSVEEYETNGKIVAIGSNLNVPAGVAVNAAGDVFVANQGNDTVEEFTVGGATIRIASNLNNPSGVAVDAAGDVFVTVAGSNAVEEFEPDGAIVTITSGFSNPTGVAVDNSGDLYVCDSLNNRVVEMSTPQILAASPSSVTGSGPQAVTATLSGLTPGATYYYRAIVAVDGEIFTASPAGSFIALPQPTVTVATTGVGTGGATYGQSLSFVATVAPPGVGETTPTGTVQFAIDGVDLGSAVALVNGAATSPAIDTIGAGTHDVTASYSGDTSYGPDSGELTQVIDQAPLTVTAKNQTRPFGQPNPTLTDTITGFVNDDSSTVVTGSANLSTTATPSSAVGTDPIITALGTLAAANYDFTTFVNATLTIVPALTASLTPVAGPTNVSVANEDVTFSVPINTSSFTSAALILTDCGSGNLINGGVTITLVPSTASTYAIGGLSSLTTGQGLYTLTVNAALVQDQNGFAGVGTSYTSWLMDTTPPVSKVSPLATRGTSLAFPVSVTGSDGGSPPSGVASYDIYSATNGGLWALWTTVPASNPTATFTGQSNTTYTFYSIAHDLAGNTEVKTPVIEASTYLPDLTPSVTFVDGTTGTNPSTVNTTTGTFTLNLTGSDPGGGVVTYFEVFASVDSGAYQLAAPPIPAGPADSSGNVHATTPYQGLTDGANHTYAFYSIGFDSAGNTQSAPTSPNLALPETFASATPSQLQVSSLVVENGAVERSYIRYLQVDFNESDSQSAGELTQIVNSSSSASPDIQLYQYDLNDDASSKTAVSLSGVTVELIDHAIELDFGANGIGGNPNTTTADGYYELDIKLPSGATAVHHFYRLLGDVTGDGTVDSNDLNAIAAEINLSNPIGFSPLGADVNGDGSISALDLTLATRAKGHKLKSGLSLG